MGLGLVLLNATPLWADPACWLFGYNVLFFVVIGCADVPSTSATAIALSPTRFVGGGDHHEEFVIGDEGELFIIVSGCVRFFFRAIIKLVFNVLSLSF